MTELQEKIIKFELILKVVLDTLEHNDFPINKEVLSDRYNDLKNEIVKLDEGVMD